MKLILAIVQDKDSNILANKLSKENIRVTKLSSTGGFLKSGNSTFIIGIEDKRIQYTLDLIKQTCQSRKKDLKTPVSLDLSFDDDLHHIPSEVKVGGATIFVLKSEGFYQF